jgi:hypothetical protein
MLISKPAQRKFKAVPSPLGRILRARWLVDNPRLSDWSRDTIWRESPKKFKTGWSPASGLSSRLPLSPLRLSIEIPFQPTRFCAEAQASKGDAHGDPRKL